MIGNIPLNRWDIEHLKGSLRAPPLQVGGVTLAPMPSIIAERSHLWSAMFNMNSVPKMNLSSFVHVSSCFWGLDFEICFRVNKSDLPIARSWKCLGWNTSQKTIKAIVEHRIGGKNYLCKSFWQTWLSRKSWKIQILARSDPTLKGKLTISQADACDSLWFLSWDFLILQKQIQNWYSPNSKTSKSDGLTGERQSTNIQFQAYSLFGVSPIKQYFWWKTIDKQLFSPGQ